MYLVRDFLNRTFSPQTFSFHIRHLATFGQQVTIKNDVCISDSPFDQKASVKIELNCGT